MFSSDFITLLPLLFLQGRYSYFRTAQVVFYSFYKNCTFPIPMMLFSFWSGNSGQVLYIPILMSVFNLFCTSLPPLFAGWYERDAPESVLLCQPSAYSDFKRNTIFTTRVFMSLDAQRIVARIRSLIRLPSAVLSAYMEMYHPSKLQRMIQQDAIDKEANKGIVDPLEGEFRVLKPSSKIVAESEAVAEVVVDAVPAATEVPVTANPLHAAPSAITPSPFSFRPAAVPASS